MPPQAALDFSAPPAAADPALAPFHPILQRWFAECLGEPTEPQRRGWPLIHAGRDVLISAPTGSGKTLSAFFCALDRLFRAAVAQELPERTRILYVSPLKALGNDVRKNLLQPLEQIEALAHRAGLSPHPIRVQVRTGDTPPSERAGMVRKPPHILITTPESLYLYLTSRRARETLRSVDTVIVDEIHALARDKRGSHLSLSLERLKALTGVRPQLVGLSATQKPIDAMASFLVGGAPGGCAVVESGHVRPWELSVEIPDDQLGAVATHEMWGQVYDRLLELARTHRTTLIFTNTRRMAERVAHDLGERLGPDQVAAHHGSMARELRLDAEERLKAGRLKVMVATASLELGIDIGEVDLVCQLGTPRAIATCLQRVGRANHHKAGVSKGILFALTRDELVECAALLRSIRAGILDAVIIPPKPLDILAQQIVAACAVEEWDERELFATFRRAAPYRDLTLEEFEATVAMLAEGVATSRGRRSAHLHRDRVSHRLRGRKGAHLAALMNGGAIPETFTFRVVAEPEGKQVGTLDEDFAVESQAGDVFLLGSTAWRIQSVRGGVVRVEDAHGAAPSVPFWLGEAPARTRELSFEVGWLREELLRHPDPARFLEQEVGLGGRAADELLGYLREAQRVLGALPTCQEVVAERFFDEAGGMQLLIHAPFGGRINRAWGLALRKSFCRSFDFELQAAASDDGLLLSLGEQHSFPLEEIFDFVHPDRAEEILVQAVLQSPLFGTRFRWNATRALALQRFSNGQKIPPQLQRARSDDLMASVFPAQVACQDNHGGGPIEPPDHPLVHETLANCLHEALDLDGLKEVLRAIKDGGIRKRAVDLPEPSPLAHALVNSQPYTFLDDAPLEERRARAVRLRRTLPEEDATAMGALDPEAIQRTVEDAQPPIRDPDELFEALLQLTALPARDVPVPLADALLATGRATWLHLPVPGAEPRLVCIERLVHVGLLYPGARLDPALVPLEGPTPSYEEAVLVAVRGRMEIAGPVTSRELASALGLTPVSVDEALFALERQGLVLRGRFHPNARPGELEWCDRRLLQRIHRLTVGRLRKEIEPLSSRDLMRFLFRWHRLDPTEGLRGRGGLLKAVELLEGYEAPAGAWEHALLPARVYGDVPRLLEEACWAGDVSWGRLSLKAAAAEPGPRRGAPVVATVKTEPEPVPRKARPKAPGRNASLTFVRRASLDWMLAATRSELFSGDALGTLPEALSPLAVRLAQLLDRRGASFFPELVRGLQVPAEQVEDALWELLAHGLVTADGIENLRVLQSPKRRRRQTESRPGGAGRWSLWRPLADFDAGSLLEQRARLFLRRYGIVFRELVMREPLALRWRDLATFYRRLEARGEIRGGRFVAGFSGEQFALPEAVDLARAVRRTPTLGAKVRLSAVDPLNLTGLLTPAQRVPAILGRWIDYLDGVAQPVDSGAVAASEHQEDQHPGHGDEQPDWQ